MSDPKLNLLIATVKVMAHEIDRRIGVPEGELPLLTVFNESYSNWSFEEIEETRKMFHHILYNQVNH